jgi:flagellar protein FliO/FliZ
MAHALLLPKNFVSASKIGLLVLAAAGLAPCMALAAEAPPPPPVLSATAVMQLIASLALVLAVIGALAWLMKRFGNLPSGRGGLLRVVASAAVGQKERVVLLEIGDTWLVLGVAPGQVATLHSLPRGELPAPPAPAASFAQWLQRKSDERAAR